MPSARLFIALYPPLEVSTRLALAMADMPLPVSRPTNPTQVHLTLLFLGDTDSRDLTTLAESMRRAASGVPPLHFRCNAISVWPEEGPARLIAAVLDPLPLLTEFQHRLAARLARPSKRQSRQAFIPHLTLARFPSPVPRQAMAVSVRPMHVEFQVGEVCLMGSHLKPGGAVHSRLDSVALTA